MLSYRLSETVRYHLLKDGQPILILSFPLKIVYIHRCWRAVLDIFAKGGFILFEDIVCQTPELPPEKIDLFLRNMCSKMLMEQKGIPVSDENAYPFVSVIVPVRNRPREIEDCLCSLKNLDYPMEKTEIIVVDDASEDNTPQVVAGFSVQLIELGQRSQASFCRNLGARHANGEILAFIDSDCLADPLWLRELTPAFRDASLGAVGGLVDSYYETKQLDNYEKVKSSLSISTRFIRSSRKEHFFYVPACNFLVRRELFLGLGGFQESLHVGEDVDFCWRLQDSGKILEYRPEGKIFHKHRNQLIPFCTRRFDYGTSEPKLQQLHPGRVKQLFLPLSESLFWITLALSLFLKSGFMFIIPMGVLVYDCVSKYRKIHSRKIPIGFPRLSLAVFRSYLTFIHHCCSFVSRYYLIMALILFPFFSMLPGIVFSMHALAGIVEYRIKRPRMNPLSFFFHFSLEQLSYQAGVWRGCFREMNFNPVAPRIITKRK